MASGKYEAVLTVDADAATSGNQALTAASYVLTLKDNVTDLSGNKLDGLYDGTAGSGNFTRTFTVLGGGTSNGTGHSTNPGTPSSTADTVVNTTTTTGSYPATASDAEGDYIIAWVSYASDSSGDIYAQLYDHKARPLAARSA